VTMPKGTRQVPGGWASLAVRLERARLRPLHEWLANHEGVERRTGSVG
jgi:hypothetical protein